MDHDLDRYVTEETLHDGTPYVIRPIRADDVNRFERLFRAFSRETTYFRFMAPLERMPRAILESFCNIDYDREFALVAEVRLARRREFIGVTRYLREEQPPGSAQIMLVVADGWTNRGAGRTLYRRLVAAARDHGIRTMSGLILESNCKMISMLVNSEFRISSHIEDDLFAFSFDI